MIGIFVGQNKNVFTNLLKWTLNGRFQYPNVSIYVTICNNCNLQKQIQ